MTHILMAKCEAVYQKKMGRFVVMAIENMPKLPWTRFMMPSTELNLDDRVQIRVDIYVKKTEDGKMVRV